MNERDRLVKIMESEGMSARQFSQEIGISAGAISNIMSGRNKPSLDVLQAVLRRFRAISCNWLIMGVGTMYLTGGQENSPSMLFTEENDVQETPNDVFAPTAVLHSESTPHGASLAARTVEKVLIFYSDGTFEER